MSAVSAFYHKLCVSGPLRGLDTAMAVFLVFFSFFFFVMALEAFALRSEEGSYIISIA